jgi:hypothetical protein
MKLKRHFRHVVERIRERRAVRELNADGFTVVTDYRALEQRALRQMAKVERFTESLIANGLGPKDLCLCALAGVPEHEKHCIHRDPFCPRHGRRSRPVEIRGLRCDCETL